MRVKTAGGISTGNNGLHEVIPQVNRGNRNNIEDRNNITHPAYPLWKRPGGQDRVTCPNQEKSCHKETNGAIIGVLLRRQNTINIQT